MLLDIQKQGYRYLETRRMSMSNITGDKRRVNGYLFRFLTDLILPIRDIHDPTKPQKHSLGHVDMYSYM
jgi:hypothetical protein